MARLTIEGVGKTYRGGVRALAGLSLEVEPGVLGLLGPNGAGKSTLMRILATITQPTEGRVLWEGEDVFRSRAAARRLRAALGYLPQDFGIYPHLSAVEFLHYLAAVRRVPAAAARACIPELLRLVNLESAAGRPLGGFSGGMRQRVGIAQALLSDPRLLIVDEPTVGLDPEERLRLRNLLSELAGDRIVILSTHIVSDVEAAAGVIARGAAGRLVARATPEEMLGAVEGKVWEWVVPAAALPEVKARFLVSATARRSDGVRVRAVAEARPSDAAVAVPPNLEDAYLHHLRRSAGGAREGLLEDAASAGAL